MLHKVYEKYSDKIEETVEEYNSQLTLEGTVARPEQWGGLDNGQLVKASDQFLSTMTNYIEEQRKKEKSTNGSGIDTTTAFEVGFGIGLGILTFAIGAHFGWLDNVIFHVVVDAVAEKISDGINDFCRGL